MRSIKTWKFFVRDVICMYNMTAKCHTLPEAVKFAPSVDATLNLHLRNPRREKRKPNDGARRLTFPPHWQLDVRILENPM